MPLFSGGPRHHAGGLPRRRALRHRRGREGGGMDRLLPLRHGVLQPLGRSAAMEALRQGARVAAGPPLAGLRRPPARLRQGAVDDGGPAGRQVTLAEPVRLLRG